MCRERALHLPTKATLSTVRAACRHSASNSFSTSSAGRQLTCFLLAFALSSERDSIEHSCLQGTSRRRARSLGAEHMGSEAFQSGHLHHLLSRPYPHLLPASTPSGHGSETISYGLHCDCFQCTAFCPALVPPDFLQPADQGYSTDSRRGHERVRHQICAPELKQTRA